MVTVLPKPVEAPKPLQTDSPAFRAAEQARVAAETVGIKSKQEVDFQDNIKNRPKVVAEADKHLADAEHGMRSRLQKDAREIDQLRLARDADPSDNDKAAAVNKAEAAYVTKFKLAEAYAGGQKNKAPGKPDVAQANNKNVLLENYLVDISQQLRNVNPRDRVAVEALISRQTAVALSLVDLKDAVENVSPGMKARAGKEFRQFARALTLPDPVNAREGAQDVHDIMKRSSLGAEYRRANIYRQRVLDATLSSPAVTEARALADRAMMEGDETAVEALQQKSIDVMAATIDAIYADDAKVKAAETAAAEKAKAAAAQQVTAEAGKNQVATASAGAEKAKPDDTATEIGLLTAGLKRALTTEEKTAANALLANESDKSKRMAMLANIMTLLMGGSAAVGVAEQAATKSNAVTSETAGASA